MTIATTEPLIDYHGWRRWVRDRPISAAVLIGIVATQMATLVGYFMNVVGLPQLNWPRVNGGLVLPDGSPGAQWAAGAFVHHIDGVVFTIIFAALLWHRMPGGATSRGNLIKGLIHGTMLGLTSIAFLTPYAYFPKVGIDIFSFGIPFPLEQTTGVVYDGLNWKLPLAIMVWHWVYGLFVGLMFDPAEAE